MMTLTSIASVSTNTMLTMIMDFEIVGVWNHQRAREYEDMRMKNSSYGSDRMPVVVLASLEAEAFRQSIVP